MRELLLQEREVGGDFHSGSEVSPEGTGLQGGEEGVEFGEVGALAGLLVFDGFDDGGEAVLEVEGWIRESDALHTIEIQPSLDAFTIEPVELSLPTFRGQLIADKDRVQAREPQDCQMLVDMSLSDAGRDDRGSA